MLERSRGFEIEATPTVSLCRIASGYASEMSLLISALRSGMFGSVRARHLLHNHNASRFMKVALAGEISGYIKHNSVAFDSSLEARRSLQRSRLSRSLIHERLGHLQKNWRTERKLSAGLLLRRSFSSSCFKTMKNGLFCLFHHTFATLQDGLLVDLLSAGGTSCSTILVGFPKKAFWCVQVPRKACA